MCQLLGLHQYRRRLQTKQQLPATFGSLQSTEGSSLPIRDLGDTSTLLICVSEATLVQQLKFLVCTEPSRLYGGGWEGGTGYGAWDQTEP